ncbi:hypothetical protein FSP39_013074 [Pinctada imbricata]|uniref:Mitotic-spindle organizing protein 2-like n=1 Tax=Pinctada imbricata TaxID=66713 RepID=A0AA88XH29_PINIB|nr:hypothetical protein FSP39_013074 [Pinctada imbricata]
MSKMRETETLRFAMLSKHILSADEWSCTELSQLAGITLDPKIFKIILDLLKMNVAPQAILQVLKYMCGQRRKKVPSTENLHSSGEGEGVGRDRRVRSSSRGRISSGSRKHETRR